MYILKQKKNGRLSTVTEIMFLELLCSGARTLVVDVRESILHYLSDSIELCINTIRNGKNLVEMPCKRT